MDNIKKYENLDGAKLNSKNAQSNELTNNYLPLSKTALDTFAIIIASTKKGKTDGLYTFNIKRLLEILQIQDSNYTQLTDALAELIKVNIKFNYFISDHQRARTTNIIDYIDHPTGVYGINDQVEIQLTRGIMPHIYNLTKTGNFTVYQVRDFLSLRSVHSKKLYQLFSQYRTTGYITRSKDEIQALLGTDYKQFKVLMSQQIKPAIKEIESKTNVSKVQIIPQKRGRTIYSYIFKFGYEQHQKEIPLLPTDASPRHLDYLQTLVDKWDLTNHQASKILNHIPTKEIGRTLHILQVKLANGGIESKPAYAMALFKLRHGLNFNQQ